MGKTKEDNTFDVKTHILVPEHFKLSDAEKKKLLDTYKITISELPRISIEDPALANMDLTTQDVIKIVRPSATAGTAVFYRRVVK